MGSRTWFACVAVLAGLVACGDDGGGAAVCKFDLSFDTGGQGVADPLSGGAGQARAGRLTAAADPGSPSGLGTWHPGDWLLANDKIAVVIEDVGASDLYDPWGGKPVGVMRVNNGALVDPADFGEFFILTGRYSLVTTSVGVIADGTDGKAAVVRATGLLRPTPFFETLVAPLLRDDFGDIPAAIDYVLEPGADYVNINVTYHSPRTTVATVPIMLHGFMYTPRTPTYAPGVGFDTESKKIPYLAFIDDDATSWAYMADQTLTAAVSQSGFTSNFTDGFDIAACGETQHHHARLIVGGPGLDPLLQAVARTQGETQRAISGVVRDSSGAPAAGVRVHAEDMDGGYITRAMSGADGGYTLHVPAGKAVELTGWRRGDAVVGPVNVAAGESTADLSLPATGTVHVTIVDSEDGQAVPARVQLLPADGSPPSVPDHFGEPAVTGGRLYVEYPLDGDLTMTAPPGTWNVVVSRGYEYELYEEQVTVTAGATVDVAAVLDHVVDTTGVMCADFHIHTIRSADSPDDAADKVKSAVADGLEIPVRSDHEYVNSFAKVIEELGAEKWAFGMTSVELTTMETFGHFGVIPLVEDPDAVNGGAPLWQHYPSADDPTGEVTTMTPPELFAEVRARPEHPTIIINHPRGGVNYFTYAGYDPVTGTVQYPSLWDDEFKVVEVFNSSSWPEKREREVADWLSFLRDGRRVFAVGSSDSHKIRSSPVGYPRTCLQLGTDDPQALTPEMVRAAAAAGHSAVVGGIYVSAHVGQAGPGDDAMGLGTTAQVQIEVQAASWVDVEWMEVVVNGETADTIAILPEDADPQNPAIRFDAPIEVPVAASGIGTVVVAVWGEAPLDPVHPGRQPFGVTNPIFLHQ